MEDNEQNQIQNYLQQRNQEQAREQHQKKAFIMQHIYDEYRGDQQILEKFARYFLNFLKQNKGIKTQEHNLALLTFQELEWIVRTFKQVNIPKIKDQKRQSKIIQTNILEDDQQIQKEIKQIELKQQWNARKVHYTNGAWDYQLNGYQECKKQKPYFNLKGSDDRKIEILFGKAYTKKRGGFFSLGGTLQLWIQIKSQLINGSIQRNVQDFIFLRQALKHSIPFTYIPPLDIDQNMRKKLQNEENKSVILNECKRFINSLCNNEEFLQNFYTFRFFTQKQYDNYVNHKKSMKQHPINHTKLLNNQQGCVQIEISERNQQMKKDYGRKSEYLQKVWKNVTESNLKIIQKFKQIQTQMNLQKKEFESIINDIRSSNQLLHSQCYQKLMQIFILYMDVYRIHQESVINMQSFFKNVNTRHSNQAQKNWRIFQNYKAEVLQYSSEYQVRRKVFLDKEQSQQKGINRTSMPIYQDQKSNKSIISDLGIEDNSEKQLLWIQRYSKWQAYINSKFIKSFQNLIESDKEMLKKIIKDSAQKTLQIKSTEELSYISNIQVFS